MFASIKTNKTKCKITFFTTYIILLTCGISIGQSKLPNKLKLSEIIGRVGSISLTKALSIKPTPFNFETNFNDLQNVKIEAYDGGEKLVETCFSDSMGIFVLSTLQYGKYYKLIFSKPGYYSRNVSLYTVNIPDSVKANIYSIAWPFDYNIKVVLFKVVGSEYSNPFVNDYRICLYKPIEKFAVSDSADFLLYRIDEERSIISKKSDNPHRDRPGAIVEDNAYTKSNYDWEQNVIKKLITNQQEEYDLKIANLILTSRIEKLDKEKVQSEKLLLLKSNELIKSEAQKEKVIAENRTNELKLTKLNSDRERYLHQEAINKRNYILYFFIFFLILLLIFSLYILNALKIRKKQNEIIFKEKQRSEELLLNILPESVAEELKSKGESEAKLFDNVTVMFIDFVNFTSLSEHLSPAELVTQINLCFSTFDKIIEKYELEKIKTTGDAYLAVSGLPQINERHAFNVVNAAKEILSFMKNRYSFENKEYKLQDVRIGINSGSVVAGIVGVKKFAYDIWGDTVNIAARMEQNCDAGRINLSGSTYNIIKNEIACEYRGKMYAKNKGDVDMFYIV